MSPVDDDDQEQGSDGEVHHDGLAEAALSCNCCRRKKLRCSKELPTCQHCRKTGNPCSYESKRGKPGMKAGAIGLLHKRLDNLERLVEDQRSRAEQPRDQGNPQIPPQGGTGDSPYQLLAFFAREFQRFNDRGIGAPPRPAGLHQYDHGAKRRRLNLDLPTSHAKEPADDVASRSIFAQDEVEMLIRAYFAFVHPWIPMLHEGRFRRRLADEVEQRKLQIIIQAMALCAARYVEDAELAEKLLSPQTQEHLRDKVIATAMKQLTVENSQALIILSFHEIGSGRASHVWSIVGALSRNVEYLQLATEHDETERVRVSQPVASLAPAQDWTEEEERRRVFWNVFNLDRLCSVMTGWNTSLTSDDVNRRLPCDGIKWRKEDAVTTPYFGIWDKSAGRIGNPLTLLPTHYTQKSAEQLASTPSDASSSPRTQQPGAEDMSTVGAFAYAVEATESLSRVTTYFLQQRVDMREQKDITSWLTRFKELDLRLVYWKMLLPHKWKVDATQQQSTRMDPNLTLAHITHNASMILLHQLIAFPPREWTFRNRLPSICSTETCHSAAVEISTIAENYLRTAPHMPVSSQFSFCLYIAARVLLLQYGDSDTAELAPQFWSLTESLDTMGRRWTGQILSESGQSPPNLAQKYSAKLGLMLGQMTQNPQYHLPVLAYTKEIDHSSDVLVKAKPKDAAPAVEVPSDGLRPMRAPNGPAMRAPNPERSAGSEATDRLEPLRSPGAGRQVPIDMTSVVPGPNQAQDPMYHSSINAAGLEQRTPSINSAGLEPRNPAMNSNGLDQRNPSINSAGMEQRMNPPSHGGPRQSVDLGEISQLLLNQQFMELNRVISYDDGMFGTELEGTPW